MLAARRKRTNGDDDSGDGGGNGEDDGGGGGVAMSDAVHHRGGGIDYDVLRWWRTDGTTTVNSNGDGTEAGDGTTMALVVA